MHNCFILFLCTVHWLQFQQFAFYVEKSDRRKWVLMEKHKDPPRLRTLKRWMWVSPAWCCVSQEYSGHRSALLSLVVIWGWALPLSQGRWHPPLPPLELLNLTFNETFKTDPRLFFLFHECSTDLFLFIDNEPDTAATRKNNWILHGLCCQWG